MVHIVDSAGREDYTKYVVDICYIGTEDRI
jgi:hypothetical protein